MILVPLNQTWEDWRYKARELLAQNISPHQIQWQCDQNEFVMGEPFEDRQTAADIRLSKEFLDEAMIVSCYRDPSTWALLYRMAWRLIHDSRKLLLWKMDPDVRDFEARRHSVGRDLHKMHAFVRFREVPQDNKVCYMAWYRPDHRIVRLAAPFFKDRFNGMNWVIMTDDETMSWDQEKLSFSPGVPKEALPPDDKEELWKTYYSSIFNPARVKVSMMKKEMAVRYWDNLPEAQLISPLLEHAPARVEEFYLAQMPVAKPTAINTLEDLRAALSGCRACEICSLATAPVASEGPTTARMAFVGEQPGDEEDKNGRPFIGPAGKVLMEAFAHADIKREEVFLTNAVKGFKWVGDMMNRQHRTAGPREISACRPWVQTELKLVKPEILVCLGRTAAQSILGKMVKLEDVRGKFFATPFSDHTIVLPHPAAILRTPAAEQAQAMERFLREMEMVKNTSEELKARTNNVADLATQHPQ